LYACACVRVVVSMSANLNPGMTRDARALASSHGPVGSARAGPVSTQMALQRGDVDLDLLSGPGPITDDGYDFDVEGDTQPSVLQWLAPEPELMQALVIDPDRESRFYLRAKLSMAGLFLADEAATGGEALYLLKTRRYRVVILDLDLPDMEGWLLAAQVRLSGGSSLAETLVLTRRKLSWLDEIRARRAGANHWLRKPLHPIELAKVLHQVS
jgi:CheY-like chemotaxis protein